MLSEGWEHGNLAIRVKDPRSAPLLPVGIGGGSFELTSVPSIEIRYYHLGYALVRWHDPFTGSISCTLLR